MKDAHEILREWLTASASSGVSGTLESDVTATGLTWTLGSGEGSAFSTGIMAVKCGSEVVHCIRSGDVLTVYPGCRGACGTTAAAHTAGATVSECVLYDLVGTRVSGLPPANNTTASVWLQVEDDVGMDRAPARTAQFLARCFGGGERAADARAVYRALCDRIDNRWGQAVTSGRIISAVQSGGGELMRDPDAEWLFCAARILVEAA